MGNNDKINGTAKTEDCVYYTMEEFKDKFLPEPKLNKIVNTDEEARKLGAQLAIESINNVKFDSLHIK